MKNEKKLIAVSFILLLSGIATYFYMKEQRIEKLTKVVAQNEKRIDYLLSNHNCKVSSIKLLETELSHFVIRKSRLQKMTKSNPEFIDVPATIDGIKKECNL